FASRLEWVRPIAHVPGAGSVQLVADTLLIDTEFGVCLVTYRASLGRANADAWGEPHIELYRGGSGKSLLPQHTAEFDAFDLEQHTVDTPFLRASRPLPGEETTELARRDTAPPPAFVNASAGGFPAAPRVPGSTVALPSPAVAAAPAAAQSIVQIPPSS